jgi:RNA polymerase-binding transcription factor DksA
VEQQEARERLTRLRDEFASSAAAIRERLAQPQRDATDIATVDQHPADVATETAERELDVSRLAMFEARVTQIDTAFDRIKQGDFGRCVVCGQPIPDERLELVPDTLFCVKDAQREQARQQ